MATDNDSGYGYYDTRESGLGEVRLPAVVFEHEYRGPNNYQYYSGVPYNKYSIVGQWAPKPHSNH